MKTKINTIPSHPEKNPSYYGLGALSGKMASSYREVMLSHTETFVFYREEMLFHTEVSPLQTVILQLRREVIPSYAVKGRSRAEVVPFYMVKVFSHPDKMSSHSEVMPLQTVNVFSHPVTSAYQQEKHRFYLSKDRTSSYSRHIILSDFYDHESTNL